MRRRRKMGKKHLELLKKSRPLYEKNLRKQKGHCALCPQIPVKRRLDLDHDHDKMVMRGLLCHKCNRALPNWITPEWLRAAANYLENPPWED